MSRGARGGGEGRGRRGGGRGGGEEGEGRGGRTEFRIKFSGLGRTLFFGSLLLPSQPVSLSFPITRARASSLVPLAASALVPSPRRLAGARFFPTRSSGIPPLLTAASPSCGRTRIRSWETFLLGPLSLSLPLSLFFSRFRH